eukprot:gene43115-39526_t
MYTEFKSGGASDRDRVLTFLRTRQKQAAATEQDAAWIAAEFDDEGRGWQLQDFSRYIVSKQNGWWDPSRTQSVYQDMQLTLQNYYISCSHNTYLTGDQLSSRSSAGMYRSRRSGRPFVLVDGLSASARVSLASVADSLRALAGRAGAPCGMLVSTSHMSRRGRRVRCPPPLVRGGSTSWATPPEPR